MFLFFVHAFYQILLADELAIMSYLYVCVWKTVGRINEDFLQLALLILNPVFTVYMSSIMVHSKVYTMWDQYRFCHGLDDSGTCRIFASHLNPGNVFFYTSAVFCFLLVCRICLNVRRQNIQIAAQNPNAATGNEIPLGNLEILKISKIILLVTMINLIPNIIFPIFKLYLISYSDYEFIIRQFRIAEVIVPMFTLSFLYPILSIYSRESLVKKFTKLCKELFRNQRIHDINASS